MKSDEDIDTLLGDILSDFIWLAPKGLRGHILSSMKAKNHLRDTFVMIYKKGYTDREREKANDRN